MRQIEISDLDHLAKWAGQWAKEFRPRDAIYFSGPVGAGKTTLISLCAREMGVSESEIASPSYGIHHSYRVPGPAAFSGIKTLHHVDLYRLEDEDDLESTGFWDLFSERDSVLLIEWADRLEEDILPPNWRKCLVEITVESSGHRQIKLAP